MEKDLRKCRNCGSTSLEVDASADGWSVECNGCRARGPIAETQTKAWDNWNRFNAPDPKTPEQQGYVNGYQAGYIAGRRSNRDEAAISGLEILAETVKGMAAMLRTELEGTNVEEYTD